MDNTVLFKIDGSIDTLTFNRPHALNAIDIHMARRMSSIAVDLSTRSDLRVLVLRGAGPAFMSGGDIQTFIGQRDVVVPAIGELIDHFHAFVLALCQLPIPVITGVHGSAVWSRFFSCNWLRLRDCDG